MLFKVVTYIFCLVVFVKAQENVSTAPVCTENEEFSECGANGCQNTCADPTFSWRCRAMCIAGCICKEGYLRHANGTCVLKKYCGPEACGNNEVWNPCEIYCTSDRLCQLLAIDCVAPPKDWKCSGRCECAEGFVRINRTCEEPSKCSTMTKEEPPLL